MKPYKSIDGEEWRPINDPTWSSRYSVSSFGRVRSEDRIEQVPRYTKGKYSGYSQRCEGMLLKQQKENGYMRCYFSKPGLKNPAPFWVHRLVYAAFKGPIPEKKDIDHQDGDKSNNTPDNLICVSKREHNILSKRRGQTRARGTKKLSEEEVAEIRRMLDNDTITQKEIADKFKVSQGAISAINTSRTFIQNDNFEYRRGFEDGYQRAILDIQSIGGINNGDR